LLSTTVVTAVFERQPSGQGPVGTQGGASLKASVGKIGRRGHGRKRTILVPVKLSMAATVRARLVPGASPAGIAGLAAEGRVVSAADAGPARVRPGSYRIKLTVSGGGQTQQITRPVRLRR
jgi:hypothetical protein